MVKIVKGYVYVVYLYTNYIFILEQVLYASV